MHLSETPFCCLIARHTARLPPADTRPAGRVARATAPLGLLLLGACHANILAPAGDIAQQQAHLVIIATVLMLLIVVPVMVLTLVFAWHYREGGGASHHPDWHHSTQLELVIWSAPLLIIIMLGSVTWVGTHLLDPYRPLSRIAAGQPLARGVKPLEVDVVALDWKWLFIYPEQHIASVNELALPTDRPVAFRITASSVMNSFYVPALAGQIYAMPGMTSQLHAVLNHTGSFRGFSANYSGAGFSQMHFQTLGLTPAGFAGWVAHIQQQGGGTLDATAYLRLAQPSVAAPVAHYASIAPDLFARVAQLCIEPGKMCAGQMMALDARGGTGKAGAYNMAALTYDKDGRPGLKPLLAMQLGAGMGAGTSGAQKAFVRALCAPQAGAGAGAPTATLTAAARATPARLHLATPTTQPPPRPGPLS